MVKPQVNKHIYGYLVTVTVTHKYVLDSKGTSRNEAIKKVKDILAKEREDGTMWDYLIDNNAGIAEESFSFEAENMDFIERGGGRKKKEN